MRIILDFFLKLNYLSKKFIIAFDFKIALFYKRNMILFGKSTHLFKP